MYLVLQEDLEVFAGLSMIEITETIRSNLFQFCCQPFYHYDCTTILRMVDFFSLSFIYMENK